MSNEGMKFVSLFSNKNLFESSIGATDLLLLAIIALEDPRVDEVLFKFGVEVYDHTDKKVFPRPTKRGRKKKESEE